MATTAYFQISDYDGRTHEFYRFLDGYPCEGAGVFANFPLGDHDFCLDTYIRRLALEKSDKDYWTDVSYMIDLKTRTVEVSSGCYKDFNFKGSFEEAIRHFAYSDYSERDALASFPQRSDVQKFIGPHTIDGLWNIIRAIKKEIPQLQYENHELRIIEIGDNPRFYLSQDFIGFPSCEMNRNRMALKDAMMNARRIGLKTYFTNTVADKSFTMNYMIRLVQDGYILPLTQAYIPYKQRVSDELMKLELKMIVEMIKRRDMKNMAAQNFLLGIHSERELRDIQDTIDQQEE